MAGIDLTTATARLQLYLDAEAAILANQEYTIGGRRLKRADLAEVRKGVLYWDRQVKDLTLISNGCGRSLTLRPNF